MKLIGISTCFGLTLLTLVLLVVSCFTKAWWVSKKDSDNAGLWVRCIKTASGQQKCEKFETSIRNIQDIYKNGKDFDADELRHVKDWVDKIEKKLNGIRACVLISLLACVVTLVLMTVLLHFIRSRRKVKFSRWLKLTTILFNVITTVSALTACILATNTDFKIIFHANEKRIAGSWICIVVACVINFIIGCCLFVVLYVKKKQKPEKRRRKFTGTPAIHTQQLSTLAASGSIKGNKSPPYMIPTYTTTPYHNHPYMQYHADETEPHYVDGNLEPALNGYTSVNAEHLNVALTNIGDFSMNQYADLSTEDLPKENSLSTSFQNLTHTYEEVASPADYYTAPM